MSLSWPFPRYTARYRSKIADLNIPHIYLGPLLGVTKFRRDLWHGQTRIHRLSYGVVFVILGSAVLVELRLVMDRRTDTYDDSIYRASTVSRGKNMQSTLLIYNSLTVSPRLKTTSFPKSVLFFYQDCFHRDHRSSQQLDRFLSFPHLLLLVPCDRAFEHTSIYRIVS